MLRIIAFSLAAFIYLTSYSQNPDIKRTYHWYFGKRAGLDFSSGSPSAVNNGAVNSLESSASVSDTSGNLLFYTDGDTVWNLNHQVMQNGTGLLGCGNWDNSSTQGVLIIPQPSTNNIYYVFTVDCIENSGGVNGMRYSIVDMNLNGGLGTVTSKNLLLHSPSTEKLTAVHHCNRKDIWIVSHAVDSNSYVPPGKFYAYLLTNTGLATSPVVSLSGAAIDGTNGFGGVMKFSPDGNKLICVNYSPDSVFYNYPLELFDFDNSTGIVSNAMGISNNIYLYGGSFSPDGSKIYVSQSLPYYSKVYQYDISSGNQATIIASGTIINNIDSLQWCNGMQMASDGKIYIARWHSSNADSLAVIQNPNNTSCNFIFNGISLQGKSVNYGLPGFVESYFSNDTVSCEANVESLDNIAFPLAVFPIPSSGVFQIKSKYQLQSVRIFSPIGYEIEAKLTIHYSGNYLLDITDQPNGIYLLLLQTQNKNISAKIIHSN